MPLTMWINKSITSFLRSDQRTAIYNDVLSTLNKTFGFVPERVELWKNSTVKSLGGRLIKEINWDTIGENNPFIQIVDESLKDILIISITGETIFGGQKGTLEINGVSDDRRTYSDFLFELGGSIYDTLKEYPNAPMIMVSLIDSIDNILIEYSTETMGRKTISKKRVIERAYISDNIPDEENHITESSFLMIHNAARNKISFLRSIIRNVGSEIKISTKHDPLELIDAKKVATHILRYAPERGYDLKKYAILKEGSISYIARQNETLDSMVTDFSDGVIKPFLCLLSDKIEFENSFKEAVKRKGVGTLDGSTTYDN